jgi:hypothetical protein
MAVIRDLLEVVGFAPRPVGTGQGLTADPLPALLGLLHLVAHLHQADPRADAIAVDLISR